MIYHDTFTHPVHDLYLDIESKKQYPEAKRVVTLSETCHDVDYIQNADKAVRKVFKAKQKHSEYRRAICREFDYYERDVEVFSEEEGVYKNIAERESLYHQRITRYYKLMKKLEKIEKDKKDKLDQSIYGVPIPQKVGNINAKIKNYVDVIEVSAVPNFEDKLFDLKKSKWMYSENLRVELFQFDTA